MPESFAVAALPDIHVPFHDPRALGAALKYLADHRWDIVIQLGDAIDLDIISRFVVHKPRLVEGRRIKSDVEDTQAVLRSIVKAARAKNPKARVVFLEGNHEHRLERLIDAAPHLDGLMNAPQLLGLTELGVEWVPYESTGEIFRVGKLAFIHGAYHNLHHAKKHVDQYGLSVAYGHLHDISMHTGAAFELPKGDLWGSKVSGIHASKCAISLGCLCDYNQKYINGRPSKWQQGFGTFHFDRSSGDFSLFVARIHNGSFIGPNGVRYSGG